MVKFNKTRMIDPQKIEAILKPYWKPIVKESHILQTEDKYIVLQSVLEINGLWYSDSTGHMNALDLNLAFNQMMYIAIACGIDLGWISNLKNYGWDDFENKYWSDFLIVSIHSEFKAQLHTNKFLGVVRIKKITPSSKHLWFELDLTLGPVENDFPIPGSNRYAYSKMTLVIKDYLDV